MVDQQTYQELMDAVARATYNNDWSEANRVGALFRTHGLIAVYRAEDKTVYLLQEDDAKEHIQEGDRVLDEDAAGSTENE